jgi:hypothetical protein
MSGAKEGPEAVVETVVAMSEQQLAEAIADYLVKHRLAVLGPNKVQLRFPTGTLWIRMVILK